MRSADADVNDRTIVERRDPLVGTTLVRRFRIDFQLAAGGFGAIYRATDLMAGAEVALKVLHQRLATDPAVVERFRRESATLASLRDPHTITAYEAGEADDGTLYIVMELLHGESLYERFRAAGPLPWRRVVHIARGVCSSLAEAHAVGIVHRDLKPANIHLETRGEDRDFVKVLDFGIAKIFQGGGSASRNELTQAGQMIGTVDYMSPEQMVGGELTGRSDIYALGVVIYEMISGRTPYAESQHATAILAAVLTQTPDPLSSRVPVPPALDRIVARCLERDAHGRFADVAELAAALADVAAVGVARPAPQDAVKTSVYLAAPPVPSTGFEQTVLTSEATRIDVRYTASSEPVLDARGSRYRTPDPIAPQLAGQGTPTPADPVPGAIGSHPGLDARALQSAVGGHGSNPAIAPGWPPPLPHPLPPPLQLQQPPPLPFPQQPLPRPIISPAVHGTSYQPPSSYDMQAASTHDALVRRIIWVALFAVAIAVLILLTR